MGLFKIPTRHIQHWDMTSPRGAKLKSTCDMFTLKKAGKLLETGLSLYSIHTVSRFSHTV